MNITYITTNLKNGKQYVGSHYTDNIDDKYLGSGKVIMKAIKKYGREDFEREILKEHDTILKARLMEEKYIKKYNTLVPFGYNLSPTGGNSHQGGIHSKETIQKISKTLKEKWKTSKYRSSVISGLKKLYKNYPEKKPIGEKNGMFGKKQNIEKMKQRWINMPHPWIGKFHKKETKELIGTKNRGNKHTKEAKILISKVTKRQNNPMYGKKHSSKSKELMSQKALGRIWSEERKQLISIKNKGKKYSGKEYEERYIKISCKYCNILADKANHKRWHGENCKNKKI